MHFAFRVLQVPGAENSAASGGTQVAQRGGGAADHPWMGQRQERWAPNRPCLLRQRAVQAARGTKNYGAHPLLQGAGADWGGLPLPLLAAAFLGTLRLQVQGKRPPLFMVSFLPGGIPTVSREELRPLARVCRQWHLAVQHVHRACCEWSVSVHRQLTDAEVARLQQLRVATIVIGGDDQHQIDAAGAQRVLAALGGSTAASQSLRRFDHLPEELLPALAPHQQLEVVGLVRRAGSTLAGPVALEPLLQLARLQLLRLDHTIVDLGAVPEGLHFLNLWKPDRVLLPPAPHAALADRLLHALECKGEGRRVQRHTTRPASPAAAAAGERRRLRVHPPLPPSWTLPPPHLSQGAGSSCSGVRATAWWWRTSATRWGLRWSWATLRARWLGTSAGNVT